MKQRQFRYRLIRVTACVLLLWNVVACQFPTAWDMWSSHPAGPPRGGTVTIALPDALDAVQPWYLPNRTTEVFVSLTHAGLMRLDDRGAPQPELLADWSTSADQLVITATLKADLKWSDAAPLKSDDVVYTYTALKSLPVTTPLLAELQIITQVQRIDDTHVRFVLHHPYAPLFSLWAVPILPAHVLASQQIAQVNMRNLLTSAGPFVYKEQRADGAIVLAANPSYVLGPPLLDTVLLRVQQSDAQMRTDIGAGNVDIAELHDTPTPVQTGSISTTTYAQNSMTVDVFNVRQGHVTKDVRIRQALAAAAAYEMRDLFVPESWAYGVITPTQTLTDAAALLDSAGWVRADTNAPRLHDSQPVTVTMLVPADNALLMGHADDLERTWNALGIHVARHNASRDAYLAALIPPYPYDVMLVDLARGRSSDRYADMLFYEPDVRALFDSAQRNEGVPDVRGSLNLSGIQDTALSAIVLRLQTTYDNDARQHMQRDLHDALQRLVPLVVRTRPKTTVAFGARVHVSTGSMRFNSPWYLANAPRWYVQPATP